MLINGVGVSDPVRVVVPFAEPPITVSLLPRVVNLEWYEGDSVGPIVFALFDDVGAEFDVSGWVARSQVRVRAADEDVVAEFDASTSGNEVRLVLAAADNVGMPEVAVWDVQIRLGDVVTTVAAGRVAISKEVTRP